MNIKQKKKSKKKIIIWSIVGCLAALIIITTIFVPKGPRNLEQEKAEAGSITTYYTFSGAVEAKSRKTIIGDKVMQIKKVNVKVGDQIQEGDVLLETQMGEKIKAPMDGEVSKVYVGENAELMSGAQLVDIVDYSNLATNVRVDEYDLKFLKVGQKVDVTINAIDKDIQGTVASISKEAINENGVSYFTANIDLPKDEAIRVGMSAEAKILKQKADNVTTLSMGAIQFDNKNKPYVYVAKEKGMPVKKYIQTGINDGTIIEVKSGVKAGDVVMYPKKEDTAAGSMMMQGDNQ